jgi:hypothetical protein
MTITLTDSRWPELAAAVTEWSRSALKALDLAASLTIDRAEDGRQTNVASVRDDPQEPEVKRSH